MNETSHIPEPIEPETQGQLLEKRFRFRRVNEITGTFVLAVVALLVAVVIWTGHSQRWFRSNVTLRIVLPAGGAAGIRHGSEVYFLGTLVGSVSDVIVDARGRMEAEAKIRGDFFRFVRADSSAVVKRRFGVAGDSFFEITRGQGEPLPVKNASIVCNEQFQSILEGAVEEVSNEAMLMFKKVNVGLEAWTKLGVDLGETRKHLDQLAVRLENMTAGVEGGKGTIGKLLTDPAIADEAETLLARANQTMLQLQGLATNLNVTVENLQNGTARLPEITEAMANESKDLPGLVQQTRTSIQELEILIEAMQRHWAIRKYVIRTNEASVDSIPNSTTPNRKSLPLRSPKDSGK